MNSDANAPILMIDSGLGGLTVAKAVHALMPHEQIVYFGDTARLPYGNKSAVTVTTFVKQIIAYMRNVVSSGALGGAIEAEPKHVLIACNTATAMALPALRQHFSDLSISGVVEPGAKAAVLAAGSKQVPCIGIIATEATVRSKAYDRAIMRRRNHSRLLQLPTPLLVPIIEEGRELNDPLVVLALQQYLKPMIDRGIDVLVLGCTHYPMLKPLIQQIVGDKVSVIDSADQCAQDVARRLQLAELLCSPAGKGTTRGQSSSHSSSWLKMFATDNSPRFAALASRFLGVKVEAPHWVPPEELHDVAEDAGIT